MKSKMLTLSFALFAIFFAGPASAGPMDGVWVGEYVCGQGKTALALTIREAPGGGAHVLFQFSGTPQNPKVPMGSFEMKAGMDAFSGGLVFSPVKWVHQPPGYTMLGLKGKLHDQNTLMGEVTGGAGCSTFIVRRGATGFAGTFEPGAMGVKIQAGETGAAVGATVEMNADGMKVQVPGMNVEMTTTGMQGSVTLTGAPAPTGANINVTIDGPGMEAPPAPAPVAAPPAVQQTCRSVLLAKGHSSAAMIHCGDDVNQPCAVALLNAGHSPAALIHCADISNEACAVQLMQSGRNPAEIVHCD